MENKIDLLSLLIIITLSLSLINCGNDTVPVRDPHDSMKAKIEYDYDEDPSFLWGYDFFVPENTMQSLGHYFLIDVAKVSNSKIPKREFRFNNNVNNCYILNYFKMTTDSNRQYKDLGYPFYLRISHYMWDPLSGNNTFGESSYTNFDQCSNINWTYIFVKNIDSLFSRPNNLDTTNPWVINAVIFHELCHQVGHLNNEYGHYHHSGSDTEACIMRPNFSEIHGLIDTLQPHFPHWGYYMCGNHQIYFRSGVELVHYHKSNLNFPNSEGQNFNYINSERNNFQTDPSSYKIILNKSEYKKYEPVLAKLSYINHHETVDTIYYNFYDYERNTSLNYTIKSQDGEIFNKRLSDPIGLYVTRPEFLISPGDTFSISFIVNHNFGKQDNLMHFYNYGYFEPGNYTVYAEDIISGTHLKTNELEFKVVDNDSVDNNVLKLLDQKRYQEIFDNYPDNPFTEHVNAIYCMLEIDPVYTGSIDNEKINNAYFNFISKFPWSYYNMHSSFVSGYFAKVSKGSKDFNSIINSLQNAAPGNLMVSFIKNNKYFAKKLNDNLLFIKKNF